MDGHPSSPRHILSLFRLLSIHHRPFTSSPNSSHFSGLLYFSNLKSYLLISYVSPLRLGIFMETDDISPLFTVPMREQRADPIAVRRSHSMTRIFPLFHSLSANHRSDLPSKGNCAEQPFDPKLGKSSIPRRSSSFREISIEKNQSYGWRRRNRSKRRVGGEKFVSFDGRWKEREKRGWAPRGIRKRW